MNIVSRSAAETEGIAEGLAHVLRPGDVVALIGDLGTGKTTFVKGLARGLGVTEPVTSPTFTIVQQYEGRLPVAHVDVYRLDRIQELHDIGFEDLLDTHVVLVEWGDMVAPVLPVDHKQIRLEYSPDGDPDVRVIVVSEQLERAVR
jgi:tRNA threonylcarbamoyladenosine biosynthesis protein TsaE